MFNRPDGICHNLRIKQFTDTLHIWIRFNRVDRSFLFVFGLTLLNAGWCLLDIRTRNKLQLDRLTGCSLAASITAKDVRNLKARFPGVPVVTYVNTYAEVKAESDYCVTSGNALAMVRHLREQGHRKLIFLPDEIWRVIDYL